MSYKNRSKSKIPIKASRFFAALAAVALFTFMTAASGVQAKESSVEYNNSRYGFTFRLPSSWQGYIISQNKWLGTNAAGNLTEEGPIIIIRHPLWQCQNPRQDIPVMVFTQAQWQAIQGGILSVGAAPVPPTELGHNSKYVFALPARYNFSFLPGYEEVEKIIGGKPLKGYEIS